MNRSFKLFTLCATFCLSSFTFSNVSNVSIDEYHIIGTNLNISNQSITGKANRVKTPTVDEANADINGSVSEGNLILNFNETELIIENVGSFFDGLENGTVKNLSYENGQNSTRLEFTEVNGTTTENQMRVKNAKANCHINPNKFQDYKEFLLNTCLTNATINVSEIFQAKNNIIHKILGMKGSGDIKLTSLNAQVSNHNLRLKVKVHSSLTVTAKIEGKTEYDAANKRIVVRIDKAKASFFDIKGKLFDELEQMKNEDLTVNRPYVYYKVD